MELLFEEAGLIVKTVSAPEEFEGVWRLRHDVFATELRWVPEDPKGLEKDRYDWFSDTIGVFTEDMETVGSLRMITAPDPFMIDEEFACLMPEGASIDRTPEVAEITRLCVRKEFRSGNCNPNITFLLYKGLYHWNMSKGVRYSAMVVDNRCYRILRLACLPVEALGPFVTMPDGVKAAVCMLDWRRFEADASRKRPEYFEWMATLPNRYPERSLSRELCLPH